MTMTTTAAPPRIVRMHEVLRRCGLSRSTLNRLRRTGQFPAARQLGAQSIGWLSSDIDEWLASRPAA